MNREKFETALPNLKTVVFDFDGVFTDNTVEVLSNGTESSRFSKYDSMGLNLLRSCKTTPLVLSGDNSKLVSVRCAKMGVAFMYGVTDKVGALNRYLNQQELEWKTLGYVGNDVNDLECMLKASISFCPKDSHWVVKQKADYVANTNGGFGCVREICDLIYFAKSNYSLQGQLSGNTP